MSKFVNYLLLGLLLVSCAPQRAKETPTEQVQRVAVTSATQVGFLAELDALDRIVGASTPERYYHTLPDSVVNLGEDFQLNVEQVVRLHPDILLLTDYGFEVPGVKQIEAAGIRTLYLTEWKEQDPIARAEWLRVIAELVGKEAMADSILAQVRKEYEKSREAINGEANQRELRSLCTGQSYRGTWYVPTGATYMGRLLHDAGAQYIYADRTETESIPLTTEEAILRFRDADIWIGVQTRTLDELRAIDEKHTWLRSFQNGQVYHWMRRTTPKGGNDFWETGVVHPEYILSDLIWAIHPEWLDSTYEPHFIQQCLPLSTTEP